MASPQELLLEADRRGILPDDKKSLLEEARKRGLIPAEPGQEAPTSFKRIQVGSGEIEVPADATPEQERGIVQSYLQSPDFDATIDKKSGAPAFVRGFVGGAPPGDRLKTLQQYYPDAREYGDGNFVFTDPATGRPTLYNPPGFDVAGDTASIAREVTQAVGSGLGATFGAAGGLALGVPGGPPGMAAAGSMGAATGAGLGSATGGALFDASMRLLGRTQDSRNPIEQARDVALDFTAAAAGQRAGELVGEVIGRASVGTREKAAAIFDKFKQLRIEPTAGAVSGARAVQMTQKTLEVTPTSAPIMQRQAERVIEQTKAAADDIANQLGQALDDVPAGQRVKDAAKGALERFGFRQEQIYQEAFDLVGADTRVPLASVTALRKAMEAEMARAPQSLGKALRGAIGQLRAIEADAIPTPRFKNLGVLPGDMENAGIPFSALRQVRTMVGRELKSPSILTTSAKKAGLKRIYGALTEDMSAATQAAGGDATQKLAVADRFTRQFMTTAAKQLEKFAMDPEEKAFNYAISSSRTNATGLLRLRRHFLPEEWDTVAASVLHRLGKANPGAQDATGDVFSVNTFLSNWNKMSPEARKVLFGGKRYENLAPDLDRLVDVMSSLKGVERFANTSNSGTALITYSVLQTLAGALTGAATGTGLEAGAAASLIAPPVAAKLMTSPAFVRWLATPVKAETGIFAHIGRLAAVVEAEPWLRDEIAQYTAALRGVTAGPATEATPDPTGSAAQPAVPAH